MNFNVRKYAATIWEISGEICPLPAPIETPDSVFSYRIKDEATSFEKLSRQCSIFGRIGDQ